MEESEDTGEGDGMMRHAANAAAAWTAPGEVWEYVSQLVSSYHDQHDCQVIAIIFFLKTLLALYLIFSIDDFMQHRCTFL